MRRQGSFVEAEYAGKKKQTRRDKFLADMEQVVPWARLEERLRPFYPRGERGRPPLPLDRMLRVYFVVLAHYRYCWRIRRGEGEAGTEGRGAGWPGRSGILREYSVMSPRPQVCPTVPEETVRIARASFPKGNRYMRLRDELGAVFDDSRFAGLFPRRGRPAEAPWRLALVTLFQFAEGLPDRQAAEAVRGRIDWKYALALSLADPGFDSTVLSEFRSRLIKGGAELLLLEAVLTLAQERNLLSAGGRQRTDSTHVLAAVRALNRLECVIETMRHALESLAVVAPDWLLAHAQPDWAERYGHRAMDNRLEPRRVSRRL